MSLDVYLKVIAPTTIYQDNITHNLNKMAKEAGIYQHLWRPEELEIVTAAQAIPRLELGLETLLSDPERFKAFDSPNGWGRYENFLTFVQGYLQACRTHPTALLRASR